MADSDESASILVDLEKRSNDDLREMLDQLHEEEQKLSYRRRVLHGKIDILRAELVRRLKAERMTGEDVISGGDLDRLISILASDLRAGNPFDIGLPDVESDSD